MTFDDVTLTLIIGASLTAWNGYLHTKLAAICKNCVYTYKPKKKINSLFKI